MLYKILKTLYTIAAAPADRIDLDALHFEFGAESVTVVASDSHIGIALTFDCPTNGLDGQSFTIAGGEVTNKLLPAVKDAGDFAFCADGGGRLVVVAGMNVVTLYHMAESRLRHWREAFKDSSDRYAGSEDGPASFNPDLLAKLCAVFKPFRVKDGTLLLTPGGSRAPTVLIVKPETLTEPVTNIQAVIMPCA